jgi:HK97 gp10 family phage protein
MTSFKHEFKITGITPAQLKGKVKKAVEDGLFAVALSAQSEAKRSIVKGPKTGRIYKRGKGFHRASAPGQPPANDTGFLASSIFAEPIKGEVATKIEARAPYAVHLEFGTAKMAPRPFIRPAGDKAAAQGLGIIKAYVDTAL